MASIDYKRRIWDLVEEFEGALDKMDELMSRSREVVKELNINEDKKKELERKMRELFPGSLEEIHGEFLKIHGDLILKALEDGEDIPDYLLNGGKMDAAINEALASIRSDIFHQIRKVPEIVDTGGDLVANGHVYTQDVDYGKGSKDYTMYLVSTYQIQDGDEIPDEAAVARNLSRSDIMKRLNAQFKVMGLNNMLVLTVQVNTRDLKREWVRLNILE